MACLLFHALTGAPPFDGAMAAKLKGHLLDSVPSVGAGLPVLQESICLARATDKQPAERYASAGDAGSRIQRGDQGRGHGSRGAGNGDRRGSVRHRDQNSGATLLGTHARSQHRCCHARGLGERRRRYWTNVGRPTAHGGVRKHRLRACKGSWKLPAATVATAVVARCRGFRCTGLRWERRWSHRWLEDARGQSVT